MLTLVSLVGKHLIWGLFVKYSYDKDDKDNIILEKPLSWSLFVPVHFPQPRRAHQLPDPLLAPHHLNNSALKFVLSIKYFHFRHLILADI